ncbi:MAG: metal ABC transporter permease [Clostridia bacterium]|nr:metal ABC transporter permease [Clostridia bacterium]
MNDIINLLSYTFMQRAILCGIAISFSAALIGVILTLKNYSMIGHGLGEVGFAALALAVALNLPPIAVSIPIVIIAAIIIMFISQKKGESADIIIALVATGALALGVIITSFTSGFGTDSYNYMFGSILAMNAGDVILSIILTVLSIGIYIAFYNRLFLVTFDEKYAKTTGINVTFYQFLIALLTALVVVVGMRMMGTMLISSLIVFPAIIAKKFTTSFKGLVVMSVLTSIICFIIGIFTSFFLNMPTGAGIVLVYIVLLAISSICCKLAKI